MNNNGFSEFEDIFNELKNKKIEELSIREIGSGICNLAGAVDYF